MELKRKYIDKEDITELLCEPSKINLISESEYDDSYNLEGKENIAFLQKEKKEQENFEDMGMMELHEKIEDEKHSSPIEEHSQSEAYNNRI